MIVNSIFPENETDLLIEEKVLTRYLNYPLGIIILFKN